MLTILYGERQFKGDTVIVLLKPAGLHPKAIRVLRCSSSVSVFGESEQVFGITIGSTYLDLSIGVRGC